MKKLLVLISMVGVTTLLQGQGYIEFYGSAANIQTNSTLFALNVAPGAGLGKTAAASTGLLINYTLLYETTTLTGSSAPTNSAWSPVLLFSGSTQLVGTNLAAPGGMGGQGGNGGIEINLPTTAAASVELVGWSPSLGTSWGAVQAELLAGNWENASGNGYLGYTTVASMTPFVTAGAGDPLLFPTVWANGTMVLNTVIVPEPTTIALAGLGGLSLLLFRRRK
jgi:hypothetical protein